MAKKRRNAAEWRRLVAAWNQSGLTAPEFARRRDIQAGTLSWWKWRLGQPSEPDTGTSVSRAAAVDRAPGAQRLVQLIPVEEGCDCGLNAEQQVAWELSSPSGCVLRVFAGSESDSPAVTAVARALLSAAKPGSD